MPMTKYILSSFRANEIKKNIDQRNIDVSLEDEYEGAYKRT